MRFIVSSRDFLKSLQLVVGVIINHPTITILENFLFEIKDKKIIITASDGETILQTIMNDVLTEKEGKIAVQAKLLLELLKTFKDHSLTFTVNKNTLEIIDQTDKYFINLDDPDLYPAIPKLEDTSFFYFDANLFSKIVSKILFAIGNDPIRPTMTGVLFEINEKECNVVATDAHRLIKYTIKNSTSNQPFEFIMPKKALILLKNALIDSDKFLKIEFNNINACFSYLNTTWICRLIDGKYPNYNVVIPEKSPNILQINTFMLANAVKRASYFSDKSSYKICFKLENNLLRILAEDTNFNNKANIKIFCNYSGENLTICYNSKFLLEMISNVDTEDLLLKMSTPNRPGIIELVDYDNNANENMLMLLMPVMG